MFFYSVRCPRIFGGTLHDNWPGPTGSSVRGPTLQYGNIRQFVVCSCGVRRLSIAPLENNRNSPSNSRPGSTREIVIPGFLQIFVCVRALLRYFFLLFYLLVSYFNKYEPICTKMTCRCLNLCKFLK